MANFKHLDELLKSFVEGKGPAGCGCAVAKEGKVIYEGYYGFADKENGKPIIADTTYRLWSMTKVIICTAAMMLYERGKFLLDDPLYEYLPDYKKSVVARAEPNGSIRYRESKNPMLVKHAFTMSVGLPYGGEGPTGAAMAKVHSELDAKGKYDLQTEIKAMSAVPIAFEPGTHFLYGYGHDLIAGLIEIASGMTVGEFLRTEIFEPIGMTSTGYRHFGDTAERMAYGYKIAEDGTLTKIENFPKDNFFAPDAIYEGGGAGLFSTVGDYLKFTQMMANGGVYGGQRIIGRKTIDLMRANQLGEQQLKDFYSPYNSGYGYGLGVRTMMNPAAGGYNGSIGEFGWTGMAGTWTAIDPSEGFSAVYMHQLVPNMEEYFHRRVRSAVYGCI